MIRNVLNLRGLPSRFCSSFSDPVLSLANLAECLNKWRDSMLVRLLPWKASAGNWKSLFVMYFHSIQKYFIKCFIPMNYGKCLAVTVQLRAEHTKWNENTRKFSLTIHNLVAIIQCIQTKFNNKCCCQLPLHDLRFVVYGWILYELNMAV